MNCHCMSSVLCYHTPGAKSNTPLILHHVFPLTFHSFFFGSCFPRYFFPVNNGPSISLPFLQLLLALFLFGMALVVTRASENNNDNVGFFQNQWQMATVLKRIKLYPLRYYWGLRLWTSEKQTLSLEINLDFLAPVSQILPLASFFPSFWEAILGVGLACGHYY